MCSCFLLQATDIRWYCNFPLFLSPLAPMFAWSCPGAPSTILTSGCDERFNSKDVGDGSLSFLPGWPGDLVSIPEECGGMG